VSAAPSPAKFRVGVSGHRVPPKLPAESEAPLRAHIDRILATIVETARNAEKTAISPSEFLVVSSLAEGSDRIVAEAGLAAGFALEAVLPLTRAEYARDFETQKSHAEYEALLGRATEIIETGGAADDRPRAYETAGFAMLANIDLLIAIWDGEEAAGIGGTAQIVDRAIADGIVVVWINPTSPHASKLSWRGAEDGAAANVRPKDSFHPADVAAIARAVKQILSRGGNNLKQCP
jgi:hypothetical protein